MSKRTLTEMEKAFIEKFYKDKSPTILAKEIGNGIGPKTVEKYIDTYVGTLEKIFLDTSRVENPTEDSVATIKQSPQAFDPMELAGKHERGGVITMTQGLSEFLDETTKKAFVKDYRGKMSKIRKDKPGPKDVKLDE